MSAKSVCAYHQQFHIGSVLLELLPLGLQTKILSVSPPCFTARTVGWWEGRRMYCHQFVLNCSFSPNILFKRNASQLPGIAVTGNQVLVSCFIILHSQPGTCKESLLSVFCFTKHMQRSPLASLSVTQYRLLGYRKLSTNYKSVSFTFSFVQH